MRRRPEVEVYGAGKVGRGLYAAMKRARVRARLYAARAGLPRAGFGAPLVVLAVRDAALPALADEIARWAKFGRATAFVHVSGAAGPEALAPLRAESAGVAQMHPMVSFASTVFAPRLVGAHVRVSGDAVAVRRARRLVTRLGMRARALPGVDTVAYHAAAGLVANGAAALAAAGAELLARAGVDRATAAAMLGPLLAGVGQNVGELGLPGALTGPVRRGDARGVAGHLAALSRLAPELLPLYREAARAQLPLARALGEAPPACFDDIEQGLVDAKG